MTIPRTDEKHDNWARSPRPFSYVRPRLHRDEAEWLRDQLASIKDDAFEDIEKYRIEGRDENDAELAEAILDANQAVSILKTVDRAYIDMLGPRESNGR